MTKDIERYQKCQCGRIIGEGEDILISYNTPIAIVDKPNNKVYAGKYARGFSNTTSQQFTKMVRKWYHTADIIEFNTQEYNEHIEQMGYDTDWWKLNNSTFNFTI